jgi:hypothetical protein
MSVDTKILIACPTFGLEPNPGKWLSGILLQTIQDLRRAGVKFGVADENGPVPQIDHGFCFPYRKKIHAAENMIVQTALTEGYTHILRMDDDVWGGRPGDVLRLLAADVPVISALMPQGSFPFAWCAFTRTDKTKSIKEIATMSDGSGLLQPIRGKGIQQVEFTATPYTLIKTEVFDKWLYPWHDPKDECAPDAAFCQKLLDLGIPLYAHADIQLCHRHVTPWNRLFLFNAEARYLLASRALDPTSTLYRELSEMFGPDGMKDFYTLKGARKNG